jgi:hypothetical protein
MTQFLPVFFAYQYNFTFKRNYELFFHLYHTRLKIKLYLILTTVGS